MLKILELGDYLIPGPYKLHSEFTRVVNFQNTLNDSMLSLVTSEVGGGPYNIVVESLNHFPEEMHLTKQYLIENSIKLSSSSLKSFDIQISQEKLKGLKTLLFENKDKSYLIESDNKDFEPANFEDHLKNRLIEGKREIFDKDLLEGIKMLKGLGVGLTPSGDDFLIGILLGIHLKTISTRQTDLSRDKILKLILENSLGKNELSNWFLKTAFRGLVSSKMKIFISALSQGSMQDLREAFEIQARIGHSSGVDQLVGLYEVIKREYPWPTLLKH